MRRMHCVWYRCRPDTPDARKSQIQLPPDPQPLHAHTTYKVRIVGT